MGIRLHSSTWRAPLQLIDSWLPAPAPRPSANLRGAQAVMQFARAGWLGRRAGSAVPEPTAHTLPQAPATASPVPRCRVSVVRDSDTAPRGRARVVISGRMADVCSELDRLAALEHLAT
jgi:hypothetical protein